MTSIASWIKEQTDLCEKATPGPWEYFGKGSGRLDVGPSLLSRIPKLSSHISYYEPSGPVNSRVNSAIFAANSRTALPKALLALECARKALESVKNNVCAPNEANNDQAIAMNALQRLEEIVGE